MNFKRIVTTLTLLFCILHLSGQKVTLNGIVLDRESQEAVSYADVVAYLVGDTTRNIIDLGLTDDKGKYSLSLEKGNYFLEIDYLGYKKSTQKIVVTGETATQNIRTIRLRPDAEMLEGAVVVAKAVAVQTKEDTVEFNANTVKLPEGSAIEALIKKLPGAQISSDGKITVNGKEIKKILVDGKEFFSDDPEIVLKNLPANLVDKVKAYDKKSDEARLTGMDDNDDEAVLDLSVKKGMKHGWLGNVKAGLGGTPLHFDASANLNRFDDDRNMSVIAQGNDINQGGGGFGRNGGSNGLNTNASGALTYAKEKEKLKYGGSARYNFSENDVDKKSATEYFNTRGNTFGRDTTKQNKKQHTFNMDYQMEWKPTQLSTFQFRPNVSYSKGYSENEKTSYSFNRMHRQNNQAASQSEGESENVKAGATIRYVQQFASKKGRNLSLSAKLNYNNSENENFDESRTFFQFYAEDDSTAIGDSTSQFKRRTNSDNNSFSYNLQAAFTEPISTHHLMQVRYSFQQRESGNNTYVYDRLSNNQRLDSLSSEVDNSYMAHEAELNLQGKFTKLRYKIGFNLSPQMSHSQTTLGPNEGKDLKNTPVNYSPNLMFRYAFNKRHTLMLRYRGQSSAPSVENMQEVIDQSDPANIILGNPDLKPSYSNNLRLRYNNYFSGPQSNLSLNASFGNTLNAVTNRVEYDEKTGYRTSRKENIDGNWNANAFATYYTPFGKSPFSTSVSTQGSLSENVGYSSSRNQSARKSTTQSKSLSERLTVTYSKDDYEVGVNGAVTYTDSKNDLNKRVNRTTYDYTVGANATIVLPLDLNLGTDIAYNFYDGYDDDLTENSVNWNAELSRSFLKGKAANLKIRYVDILQQQKNLKRTSTSDQITDTRYNTLGSYFMVYFTYKFNSFGTTAGNENEKNPGGFNFGPGGPTGPGGGPRDFGPRGEGGFRGGEGREWNGERRRPDFENDTTSGNAPREGYRRRNRNSDSTATSTSETRQRRERNNTTEQDGTTTRKHRPSASIEPGNEKEKQKPMQTTTEENAEDKASQPGNERKEDTEGN